MALVGGEILEVEMQVVDTVLGDDLGVDFFLAFEDGFAQARNEHHITGFVLELGILIEGERHDTPVDAVGAVTLGGILDADVGVAAQHFLAGSGLLTSGVNTKNSYLSCSNSV